MNKIHLSINSIQCYVPTIQFDIYSNDGKLSLIGYYYSLQYNTSTHSSKLRHLYDIFDRVLLFFTIQYKYTFIQTASFEGV